MYDPTVLPQVERTSCHACSQQSHSTSGITIDSSAERSIGSVDCWSFTKSLNRASLVILATASKAMEYPSPGARIEGRPRPWETPKNRAEDSSPLNVSVSQRITLPL